MPSKDPEVKRATARRSYARNREKVIAAVRAHKKKNYRGVCRNCGGPTTGNTKSKIPEWCGKPECKSAQHKLAPAVDFTYYGSLARRIQITKKNWTTRKKEVSLDELLSELETKKQRREESIG